MSEKDLKEIKLIGLEIKRIENTIIKLNGSERNADLRELYKTLLKQKEAELLKKKIEAEQFVKEIDNAEIRMILSLKYIDLRSWNYISRQLHYDRSTLLKKIKKFFENSTK